MNLSLKNRVAASFITANLVVLILGFTVFFYLDSLNKEINLITEKSKKLSILTEEIRITAVTILRYQRKILTKNAKQDDIDNLIQSCDSFTNFLTKMDAHFKDGKEEVELKKIIAKMLGFVESQKLILGKASLFHRDTVGISSISDLNDKIQESFSEFQNLLALRYEERDKRVKNIIDETKRNMMITLIITFFGTILLGLVVPGKIALPFKKINDAIRELQDCNFDVSIYYNQDDEIGEIAREMNKMIQSIKQFEVLRADRIGVEHRKFDVLANMVKKKYVLVANAKSELIYMNNSLYSLLQLQSDDILNKNIKDALVPSSIKEVYELAIKRRSKIENEEVVLPRKVSEDEEHEEGDEEGAKPSEEKEVELKAYATVVPIRGKESSLDYYLMILSEEVMV